MADMVQVFQHDQGLKEELITVTNKRLSDKATEFLDAVTHDFNDVIFRVLKMSYLPSLCINLQARDVDDQLKLNYLEQFQQVVLTCWTILKSMGPYSTLDAIQSFVEFAFSPDLLSTYQNCLTEQM